MSNNLELYFNEPLAEMPFAARIVVRIIANVSLVVFIVTTLAFLISPQKFLFWLGLLMSLILLDKLMHLGKPKRVLLHFPMSGQANIADYISPKVREDVVSAHEKWFLRENNFLLQLVGALLNDKEVKETLLRLDIKPAEFEAKLKSYIEKSQTKESHEGVTNIINGLFIGALEVAIKGGADFIGPGDLFAAVSKSDDKEVSKLFALFQIQPDDLEKALIFGRFKRFNFLTAIPKSVGGFASRHLRSRVINRAWTSRPTPTLDLYALDYSELAKVGNIGFMIGHENEYERLLNVLSRRARPNALLVGEPGIGKGSLVAHVAYMISKDKVPAELFDKRLVGLDANRLVSGAEEPEIRARIQQIFQEVNEAGNIILYIPEIHSLAKGGDKNINMIDSIIPLILENDFPIIATTFPKEYKTYIEPESSVAQAFEVIRVSEASVDDAVRILIYESLVLERQFKVSVSYSAIKTSVQLAKKYFAAQPLPASASSLLKEGLVYASRHGDKFLSSDEVIAVAETRTKIPIKRADAAEADKLLNLEELIHQDLVDQEGAVKAVSESLREYRSGLSRHGGPIGTFLFVGPTGVGKTELSKILAKIQFGSVDNMIRFDMSGYQDKQSLFQFVGSPDGKLAGLLTDQVLEKPYSLVLLDEFEKAHPDILNLFLQVFDDGRLTDNLGRVVSFENTIIIATSNANSEFIKEQLEAGKSVAEISVLLKKKLSAYFKPELLNRFSSIAVFRELRPADIQLITQRILNSLAEDLAHNQSVDLVVSPEAVAKIAELGYDPVFGARPLREVVASQIKDPLSKLILGAKLSRGSKVSVETQENKILIKNIS